MSDAPGDVNYQQNRIGIAYVKIKTSSTRKLTCSKDVQNCPPYSIHQPHNENVQLFPCYYSKLVHKHRLDSGGSLSVGRCSKTKLPAKLVTSRNQTSNCLLCFNHILTPRGAPWTTTIKRICPIRCHGQPSGPHLHTRWGPG